MSEERLRLAVQSSGRLSDGSLELLHRVGIRFNRSRKRLYSSAINFPIDVYFLRDDDIPRYVSDGVADLGIVGQNIVAEQDADVVVAEKLGFGRCRLSVAVRRSESYDGPRSLHGKHIATSYPKLLSDFLARHEVEASVHTISGSVEIAPGIGLADAVCDLVSTGSTLLSNGLREVETILHSEAVLISRSDLSEKAQELTEKLRFRIAAVREAGNHKYILLNVPNEKIERVAGLLPGIKSPTVVPLTREGWSSMHSVVKEDDFWEMIDRLREAGAEGILVVPIEKMIR
ncbi:MAG: ATP phosphoribosyltransferase [Candidatus Latescibacterota bacterium]|jgi:ATP phosphoribosyltransferase